MPAGLLALVAGVIVGACFNAPQPAVQFSCDPVDAPQCPPGYSCESDGCCHRNGSDVAAQQGECRLGGLLPTGGGSTNSTMESGTAETGSSGDTASGSDESNTPTSSGSGSGSGSSGDAASTTDQSGTTAESSSSSDVTTSTGPDGSSSSG